MNGGNHSDIRQVIIERYRIDYAYHHQKELMAWTASSIYFGFSVGLFVFVRQHGIDYRAQCVLTAGLPLIFLSVFIFLNNQFTSRWHALDRIHRWQSAFADHWDNIRLSVDYRALESRIDSELRERGEKSFLNQRSGCTIAILMMSFPLTFLIFIIQPNQIDSRYRTEIPTYVLAAFFLLAQIFTVWWV